jgi:hypothetical protein
LVGVLLFIFFPGFEVGREGWEKKKRRRKEEEEVWHS